MSAVINRTEKKNVREENERAEKKRNREEQEEAACSAAVYVRNSKIHKPQ